MLGEKIGEAKGRVLSRKVLSVENGRPRIETTVQTAGTLLGTDINATVTFVVEVQPGGWLDGHGQGLLMTKDGELVTFEGKGTGRPRPGMGGSYRGCLFYRTSSSKLARLNGLACCFEHDIDEQGNVDQKVFEWK